MLRHEIEHRLITFQMISKHMLSIHAFGIWKEFQNHYSISFDITYVESVLDGLLDSVGFKKDYWMQFCAFTVHVYPFPLLGLLNIYHHPSQRLVWWVIQNNIIPIRVIGWFWNYYKLFRISWMSPLCLDIKLYAFFNKNIFILYNLYICYEH